MISSSRSVFEVYLLLFQVLAVSCLTLHHYSYDLTDIPTLMLCSGTYIGYVVVLSGEIVGKIFLDIMQSLIIATQSGCEIHVIFLIVTKILIIINIYVFIAFIYLMFSNPTEVLAITWPASDSAKAKRENVYNVHADYHVLLVS